MKFQKTPIALAAFALCAAAPFAAQAAPSVSFTSPQAGATIGQNSNYVCTATGTNASRVQFSLISSGGAVKPLNTDSTSPYNCYFNSYHYLDGNWTLRAVAYDSSGATATANRPITINNKGTSTGGGGTPTNPGPVVTFSKPANNATVSGPIACEVTAVDPDGIQKLEWLLDGKLIYTETSAPFNYCNMNTTGLAPGAHTITARATDKKGAATEAKVTVNVGTTGGGGGTPPANPGPTVTFVKPASNATVSGPIACEVTAVDPDGIQKLEWLLDGKLIFTETSAPFNYCNMNTTGLAPGAHTIKARATDKKGAATEAQVTVNVASTGGGGGTPPPAGSVDPADIKTRASADVLFSQQPNIYTDVLGSTPWMSTIAETGKHGTALANGETLRFGKEADPLNSARKAMSFQLASSDPNTGGSKRVELGFPRQIEMDKVYWIAVSVYVHDWGTLSTSDQALFGFQLHSGTKLDLSPTIALYTTKNGRTFKVSTRWSTSTSPGQSNSVSAHYAEQAIPFGRWMDFVVKFKQNTSGSGFAQVWMDGNLIVDHQGNLGFNTPGYLDYVKWGYYNWSGSGFSTTSRKVRLRNPTIVADPTGSKYTAADVRTVLATDGTSSASTAPTPATSTVASSTGGTAPTSSGGVCSTITCAAQ